MRALNSVAVDVVTAGEGNFFSGFNSIPRKMYLKRRLYLGFLLASAMGFLVRVGRWLKLKFSRLFTKCILPPIHAIWLSKRKYLGSD